MSKQDLLDALQTPQAMEGYLELRDASEIIADIRAVMQPERTLRDWFAGQALAGLVAYYECQNEPRNEVSHYVSRRAFEYADFMLAAREAGDE